MAKKEISSKLKDKMKKQQEYWTKRAEKEFEAGEKNAYQLLADLKKNYNRSKLQIERQINMFYGKWAKEDNVSLEDARKILNRKELKAFQEYLNDMMNDPYISSSEYKKLESIKSKAKIARMDELLTSIDYELDKITNNNEQKVGDFLGKTYEDQYYQSLFDNDKFLGFSSQFNMINPQLVERAVKTKYFGSNYSDRIWKNKENLNYILEQEIPRGLTLGYNPMKLASIIDKKIDTNYNNIVNLVRTEYNKVMNDATMESYQQCGITHYEILATLDSRTSDICRHMDGQVFKVSEAETGVNCPPFHNYCRTTTIAHFEDNDNIGTRLAKDENGNYYEVPENLTYEEWYNGLSIQNNGKVAYSEDVTKPNYIRENVGKNYDVTNDKNIIEDLIYNDISNKQIKNDLLNTEFEIFNEGLSKYKYSCYNSKENKFYILAGADKREVAHEIGHFIEYKYGLINTDKYKKLKENVLMSHNALEVKTFDGVYDNSGNVVRYFEDSRFISKQQGRIYLRDNNGQLYIDSKGLIKPSCFAEYFSEGFAQYIIDKSVLKNKDKNLFDYIEEILNG